MRVSLEELMVSVREREPDPAYADLPDVVLVESFTREAARIAASTCRWLLMLAEIVRRGAWAEDGIPHYEDPSLVFPHNPLAPVAGQARPDDNDCLAVLMYELQRLQTPEPDDIVIAA